MKSKIDTHILNEILKKHYASKSDMARQLGISRSHLQEVFQNKGIGYKVLYGLKKQAAEKGFDYESCLIPKPIYIGDKAIESIEVINEQGELLASITSRNLIESEGTKIVVVPY